MPNCRHSSDIDASPHSQAMQNRAFSFTEQVSNHPIARTSKLERSLQTCYLSSRSILLPIIPVWTGVPASPSRGEGDVGRLCPDEIRPDRSAQHFFQRRHELAVVVDHGV